MTYIQKIRTLLAAKGPLTGRQIAEETGIELGVARATLSKHMVGPYIEKLGKRGEDGPYRLRTPDPDPAVS